MRYGSLYTLCSLALIYLACDYQGVSLLLVWPATSLAIIGLGYFGLGAKVFGKKTDGTYHPLAMVVHMPYILYSLFLWNIVRILSREKPIDKVNNKLIIGRRLTSKEIGVECDHYIDLTSEFPDSKGARAHHGYYCFPILDASVPEYNSIFNFLKTLEGTIYIHCAQGHGRTALATIIVMMIHDEAKTSTEAYSLLKEIRPGIKLNSTQLRFITQVATKGIKSRSNRSE